MRDPRHLPAWHLQGCLSRQLWGLTVGQLEESWLLSRPYPSYLQLQGGQREVLVLFSEAPVTKGKYLGRQHNL